MKEDVLETEKHYSHRHACRPARVSVAASRFIRGREIELGALDGAVVWRLVGDEEWQKLPSQDYLRGLIVVDLTSSDHHVKGFQIIEALDKGLPISIALKITEDDPLRWIVDVVREGDSGFYLVTGALMPNWKGGIKQSRYFVSRETGMISVAEPYELISLAVVQQEGESKAAVMSQDAVTRSLAEERTVRVRGDSDLNTKIDRTVGNITALLETI